MQYGNYYNPYYGQPVQDNLGQLRQNQQVGQFYGQNPNVQQQDGRLWVQGEIGAKAYLVAAGNTVPLWDSEQPVIYLKTVNANGVPTMQKLKYTFETDQAPMDASKYVTKEEFEARLAALTKEANYAADKQSNANDK